MEEATLEGAATLLEEKEIGRNQDPRATKLMYQLSHGQQTLPKTTCESGKNKWKTML